MCRTSEFKSIVISTYYSKFLLLQVIMPSIMKILGKLVSHFYNLISIKILHTVIKVSV